jgi:hypothetical protein
MMSSNKAPFYDDDVHGSEWHGFRILAFISQFARRFALGVVPK